MAQKLSKLQKLAAELPDPKLVYDDKGYAWWDFGFKRIPRVAGGEGPLDDDKDKPPATGDKPLGPEGEKALEAWKERARKAEAKAKENSAAATERDDLQKRLEALEEQSASDVEKQLKKAVKEAEDRVRAEIEGKANDRLLKAEVRAQAAGLLQDPEDAVRFVDLTTFKVGSDGDIDGAAIRKSIENLATEKPYLAGKAAPKGNIDQGASNDKTDDQNVQPGLGRLTAAYASDASSMT